MSGNLLGSGVGGLLGLAPYPPLFKCPYFDASPIESIVAVGGVDAGNIKTFLDNGFIGVGIGSNLMPKEYVKNDEWDKASEYVKGIVGSI